MPETETYTTLEELLAAPYRRWYQFGWESPKILWARLRNGHDWMHPICQIRYGSQRWRRGWSDRDAWGFDYYLAGVIAEGAAYMREIAHGYPMGSSPEEWDQILSEIEVGMQASRKIMDEYLLDDAPEREQFKLAMDHLREHWFSLWD